MLKHEVVQLTKNIRVNSGTVSQRAGTRKVDKNVLTNQIIHLLIHDIVMKSEVFIVIERHMTQTDKCSVGKITINSNI